jgi:type I restriction enzyme M protein
MFGAIIGDVIGSRFEFHNYKGKDFTLFAPHCRFTDDTVMTLAVAKTFLSCRRIRNLASFQKRLIKTMHKVGKRYPRCGYGGRFYVWIMQDGVDPYNSFGNGSAMRVSPVGWYADSLASCEALAKATAEVTHNHPEGIKGAVAVAGAVYLARTGSTKEELRAYIEQFYRMDFTLDEIRDGYLFHETCQESVPQALKAFLESDSFEDAIRCAISIGGDSDTIAAITGSVAEAFYGADEAIKAEALARLDRYLRPIAVSFGKKYVRYKGE